MSRFCTECKQILPNTEFYYSNGIYMTKCKNCVSLKYSFDKRKRRGFSIIPGEPGLRRCLGKCGRILPAEHFALRNQKDRKNQETRQTRCRACFRETYDSGAKERIPYSPDGFRVCDVCHRDKPRHLYWPHRHVCMECQTLAQSVRNHGEMITVHEAVVRVRNETRARRFASI
jgi:hypothetical protein